jgi:hypothetical protein
MVGNIYTFLVLGTVQVLEPQQKGSSHLRTVCNKVIYAPSFLSLLTITILVPFHCLI